MSSETTGLNLGSGKIGRARRAAYKRAADKAGMSLSAWVRYILDQASEFDPAQA